MGSAAVNSVGGRGRAFCVLVEKVESGRGDGGPEDMARLVEAIDGTGLRAGKRSDEGTGRRRLRMETSGTGSSGTLDMRTDGGEGGGDCAAVVLYVVQEKRLAKSSLLGAKRP